MRNKKYMLYAVILLCFIGRGILSTFGYNMGEFATSNLTKIHPATYLISFLFVTRLISAPKKLLLRSKKPVKVYLLSIAVLLIYLVLSGNANAISFIADTLLMPVLFYAYASSLNTNVQGKIGKLALTLILINSLFAIFERAVTINVFPIEVSYGSVFRSTALLGHPLNNALVTLIFFMYVLITDMKTMKKILYLVLLLTALICFGARGCIYVALLAFMLLYIGPLFTSKTRYFIKTNKSLAIFIIVVAAISLIYITLNTSFGERLTKVSYFDDSANVRVQAWSLIDFNALQSYLWARPQNRIDFLAYGAGIEIIENFVIIWILKFGLVFASLLSVSIFYFFISCSAVRRASIMFLITLLFFVAAATNNSLASNTEALVLFVIAFCFIGNRYKFIF